MAIGVVKTLRKVKERKKQISFSLRPPFPDSRKMTDAGKIDEKDDFSGENDLHLNDIRNNVPVKIFRISAVVQILWSQQFCSVVFK